MRGSLDTRADEGIAQDRARQSHRPEVRGGDVPPRAGPQHAPALDLLREGVVRPLHPHKRIPQLHGPGAGCQSDSGLGGHAIPPSRCCTQRSVPEAVDPPGWRGRHTCSGVGPGRHRNDVALSGRAQTRERHVGIRGAHRLQDCVRRQCDAHEARAVQVDVGAEAQPPALRLRAGPCGHLRGLLEDIATSHLAEFILRDVLPHYPCAWLAIHIAVTAQRCHKRATRRCSCLQQSTPHLWPRHVHSVNCCAEG
mmetsp:Transcript_15958/g.43882  ORF Transcript_15958/g.43882 Transcript_15958/m.43882 type:complete len:252 (+) Transcript_15958:373-1128(+)